MQRRLEWEEERRRRRSRSRSYSGSQESYTGSSEDDERKENDDDQPGEHLSPSVAPQLERLLLRIPVSSKQTSQTIRTTSVLHFSSTSVRC